jgi:hypothetical protein
MNEQLELAMAMLAIFLSAVFLVSGSFYLEGVDTATRGAGLTRQADVRDGLDIRLISERDPYMRSER